MKSNTFIQMILFALAGVFATITDWAIFRFFNSIFLFKYGYMPAACLGFIFGVLVSYYLSVKFIFTTRNIKNKKLELIMFFGIGIIGLLFTLLFMFLFIEIHPFKEFTTMLTNVLSPYFNVISLWINSIYSHFNMVKTCSSLDNEFTSRIIVTIIVFFWNFFARKIIIFNDKKA